MTSSLSIEQRVGQLFFIGIPGETFDAFTRKMLSDISPGGVCLFARNCKEASGIRSLLDQIADFLPRRPFLSLDQEGGLVDRLRRIAEPMPSAAEVTASGSEEPVERLAEITAELIRILGFNMNFAPVIDVVDAVRATNDNGALKTRAFGKSADDVVRLAGKYAETLDSGGVMTCFKHFPGLGGIEVDSHEDLPVVNMTRSEIIEKELVPYLELLPKSFAHSIMTGHAVYPHFDLQETDSNGKLLPTSLSYNIVTKLLREELHFEGLALTDDLEMGAIIKNYGIGEASKMAVRAGSDFVLICNDPKSIYEGFNAVLEAVRNGEISEARLDESLDRIEKSREKLTQPLDFDSNRISQLSREIVELKQSLKLV